MAKKVDPNEVMERLEKLMLERRGMYRRNAYEFVHNAVQTALEDKRKKIGNGSVDVSAKDIVDAVIVGARKELNSMARIVFDVWGIRTSKDVGEIMKDLCAVGIFKKSDEDRFEDFADLNVDFLKEFEKFQIELN